LRLNKYTKSDIHMRKCVHNLMILLAMFLLVGIGNDVNAVQLNGSYTIDSSATPSATVFRNFSSAITYLTSADTRSDGGPSNTAPFGVSGNVTFVVANNSGPYQEMVVIPVIPGVGPTAGVTIQGNGNVLQFTGNTNDRSVIRFAGGDYVTIKNLTIRSLDITFAWGVHFYLGSDHNTLDSCIIDIPNNTSTLAANSAGIVFSNSLTANTTAGVNGYFNTISNCQINGHPTAAGMYAGIVGRPATGATVFSGNKFINNTIRNYYYAGVQWGNSNGSLFKNNLLTRTTKTALTTTHAFRIDAAMQRDTFDGNIVTGSFNGIPTSTLTFYAFYLINASGTTANPNIFMNNVVYDNKGNGPSYGFYLLTSFSNRFYNNTISIDNPTANSTTAQLGTFYMSGNTSTTSSIEIRNNIFSITQSGTGQKFSLFLTGNITTGTTLNANSYYSNSPNYNAVSHQGVVYSTVSDWQAFIGPINEQRSSAFDPVFTNLATGDLRPRDSWFAFNADTIPMVTNYQNGTPRSLPTTVGALPSNVVSLDAAMDNVITPLVPYSPGNQTISALLRNAGATTITSATISWTVNGTPQTPVSFSGSLTPGNTSNITLGTVNITSGLVFNITATVSAPNGGVDAIATNNSATVNTAAQLAGGTYSIHPTNTTPGTFNSFTDFASLVSIGGIGGPITVNVAPNTGPYNERVIFSTVPGASVTNNIVINGNNNTVAFNNDNAIVGVINLIGADHFTFNELNVQTLSPNWGIGYILTGGSDSNTINNCFIDISSVLTNSISAGIAVTGSLSSPTTTVANTGIHNKFTNNTITGSASGGPYYGMVVIPTNTSSTPNNGYVIENNTIRDFANMGIYTSNTAGAAIRGNRISRPNRSNVSATLAVYGIYMVNGSQQDTIENNIIEELPGASIMQTGTGLVYGIAMLSTNTLATRRTVVRNNLISGIQSNGTNYAIFLSTITNAHIVHNTIVIDNPASTSTAIGSGIYHTGSVTGSNFVFIQNNIISVRRGGSGVTTAIYLNTTSSNIIVGGNVYHLTSAPGSSNNHIGFYNAATRTSFSDWQIAVPFDSTSIEANPSFRTNFLQHPLTPGSSVIDNIGNNILVIAPFDLLGNPRTTTPDPGAYEFFVPAVDLGVAGLTSPTSTVSQVFSSLNINVRLQNFGQVPVTSADINWSVDDSVQTPSLWTGFLNPNDTVSAFVGTFVIPAPGSYKIKVWTSNPNNTIDSIPFNDTIQFFISTPISGLVTLNPALPRTSTNYQSLTELMDDVYVRSLGGNLTVQIAAGTYTGNVSFNGAIPGSSAINRIIFDGGDSALVRFTHSGAGVRPTLLLDNASNLEFRNITFITTGVGGGTAVQLINAADSNSFIHCSFIAPYSTSAVTNAFVASGNITGATTQGNSANYLLIDSCTASGGFYGIMLMGINSQRSINNVVRNSRIISAHSHSAYLSQQNGVQFFRNIIRSNGVQGNNNFGFSVLMDNSIGGCRIMNNDIQDMLAGTGIRVALNNGGLSNPIIVANNMINIGRSTNTSANYGIDENNNGNIDIAYNAIRINTAEASYVSGALRINNTDPITYQNVRIVNNIFVGSLGGLAVYVISNVNLPAANYIINHNSYFSSNSFPFRTGGFITPNLLGFATNANMLANLVGNNDNSIFFLPEFLGPENLRSRSPELDDAGIIVPSVTFDFDLTPRSTIIADIGLLQFDKPADDAGVIALLQPTIPSTAGLKDVVAVIRNFGRVNITTVDVTYQVDTTVHTVSYIGNIPPNGVDTVRFDSVSGPSATSQQFNFNGAFTNMKVWTSMPNGVPDSLNTNDTLNYSFCGAMAGTYTINPLGSGSNNFLTIAGAIDNLLCGGVSGPVVFEIASGTYTGQFVIPTIIGTSATNTITFTSAARNRDSVLITTATATAGDNYTVRIVGAAFINFEDLSFSNTNNNFGRVLVIAKDGTTNIMADDITTNRCRFTGPSTTSTIDAFALYFVQNGDDNKRQRVSNSEFNNGSIGVFMGGQFIVNQYAFGATIDSNIFLNQSNSAITLNNRFINLIRGNYITHLPSQAPTYAMFLNAVGDESDIRNNIIDKPAGLYGIYIGQNGYYSQPGLTFVRNNVVNMTNNGSVTNYGIFVTTSSQLRLSNNTVRVSSLSPSSYAFYINGNASFVTGSTTYPASNDVHMYNNILIADQGYASFVNNAEARISMIDVNNNLYFSNNNTNALFVTPTNYNANTFVSNYRSAIYPGSDRRSVFGNVAFSNTVNGKPIENDPSVWLVNGRAKFVFNQVPDIAGVLRSLQVSTGASDIGAYEVVPDTTPNRLVFTDSIAPGITQYMLDNGDTVAAISWSFTGLLPDSINARRFQGSLISHRAKFGIDTAFNSMDDYINVQAFGGMGFSYDFIYFYNPDHLGTVVSETDLRLAKRTNGIWQNYPFTQTLVDTVGQFFRVNFLFDFSDFTGTDDVNPLPVTLARFDAVKSGNDAEISWTTSSEINASHFEVERSVDNINYEPIQRLRSQGVNTNRSVNYSLIDQNVVRNTGANTVYYRLRSVDNDGTFEFSPIRRVSFVYNVERGSLAAYPNPFNRELTLSFQSDNEANASVAVYDIFGRLITEFTHAIAEGNNNIAISQLQRADAGVYLVKVTDTTGERTIRVIKQ
jgi:hypothetical protein